MKDDRVGAFEHLFSEPVRRSLDGPTYGAWRSISAPDAVSLGYGFPAPDALPTDRLVAAAETLVESEGDSALQYGGADATDDLAETIARRARRRGIDRSADEVVLTGGATHALDVICRTFLDPDDAVVVEAPTFMGALTVFRNYAVGIEGVPVDADGLDVDALESTLRERRGAGRTSPTLLYTIPTFQNPTGTTLARERRNRLIELAREYDFVILEDDAYGRLRYDGEALPTLAELDDAGRVLHVGTFSKTIAPGVRTGWIVAHEAIREQLRSVNAGGSNAFVRGVLGRYCAAGHLEATVPRLRRAYERRRDRALEALEAHLPAEAAWTDPDGGFFVWVELPAGIDATDLLEVAADEGVTYLPGPLFYPDDGGENCLRLSFSYAPLEDLEAGIAALGRAVASALDER